MRLKLVCAVNLTHIQGSCFIQHLIKWPTSVQGDLFHQETHFADEIIPLYISYLGLTWRPHMAIYF